LFDVLTSMFRSSTELINSLDVNGETTDKSRNIGVNRRSHHRSKKHRQRSSSSHKAKVPLQGVFEDCPLDSAMPTCQQRLQAMHDGGLGLVLIPIEGVSPSSLANYASAANALGMKVMWEMSDTRWLTDSLDTSNSMLGTYPDFVTACGSACSANGPLLDYLIRFLAQQPSTYGYYVADDSILAPGDQPAAQALVQRIKAQDPSSTTMIAAAQYSRQAAQYSPIADVIGQELYPVTSGAVDWQSGVIQLANQAQKTADKNGKKSAFILQAFTWGDCLDDGQAIGVCSSKDTNATCAAKLRYPTAADQLELRNQVLEHAQPDLIIWYNFSNTYGPAVADSFYVDPTPQEAAARWQGLSAAVRAPPPSTTKKSSPKHRK